MIEQMKVTGEIDKIYTNGKVINPDPNTVDLFFLSLIHFTSFHLKLEAETHSVVKCPPPPSYMIEQMKVTGEIDKFYTNGKVINSAVMFMLFQEMKP